MNELSRVFVRRDAAQVAPGPFVAGLAGPSHSRRGVIAGGPPDAPGVDGLFGTGGRGVIAGGPPDAPGVDGLFGTGGRGVWWCCRICAW
jgi:hypothetical protein